LDLEVSNDGLSFEIVISKIKNLVGLLVDPLLIYYNQKQNYIINKEKKKLYKKDKRYENNDEIKNKEKNTQ